MGHSDSKPGEGEALYGIVVQTSSIFSESGTVKSIYIQLVGEQEHTHWVKLRHLNLSQYLGKADEFTIVTKDVGAPILLNIKLHFCHLKDEWYADYVIISYHNNPAIFPIYDWVTDQISVPCGKACLPQNVTHQVLKTTRKLEIAKNREQFIWKPKVSMLPGFPRYSEDFVQLFGRNTENLQEILYNKLNATYTQVVEQFKNFNNPLNDFSDYMNLSEHYKEDKHKLTPNYIKDWESDVIFGRQILNTITPTNFSQCREVPSYFDVTNDDVVKLLDIGKCLDDELKGGKIFICNFYELLKGLKRNDGKHCANAVGLFYMNNKDDFVPIAIQLVPGDRDYLFTPNDSEYDWLLAKIHFRCALSNIQMWATNFCLANAICVPFANSLFRCLPRSHPLYKLLRPYLREVITSNDSVRRFLIESDNHGTNFSIVAEDLVSKTFKEFNIEDLVLPKLLHKLETDSPCLKKYYYREDALKIWNALEKYVTGVLKHYYKSDKCVENDFELQTWCREVAQEGFGWEDENRKGMPEVIISLNKLIEICTSLIFTSSVQYAAVNHGQLDNYRFVPNSPLCMKKPPHKKGEGSRELIFESLPNLKESINAIAISASLSISTNHKNALGMFSERLFCEHDVLELQKEFTKDLVQIRAEIVERNKNLEVPYVYLMPDCVSKSVTI